jgi:hypothetical protein
LTLTDVDLAQGLAIVYAGNAPSASSPR